MYSWEEYFHPLFSPHPPVMIFKQVEVESFVSAQRETVVENVFTSEEKTNEEKTNEESFVSPKSQTETEEKGLVPVDSVVYDIETLEKQKTI